MCCIAHVRWWSRLIVYVKLINIMKINFTIRLSSSFPDEIVGSSKPSSFVRKTRENADAWKSCVASTCFCHWLTCSGGESPSKMQGPIGALVERAGMLRWEGVQETCFLVPDWLSDPTAVTQVSWHFSGATPHHQWCWLKHTQISLWKPQNGWGEEWKKKNNLSRMPLLRPRPLTARKSTHSSYRFHMSWCGFH